MSNYLDPDSLPQPQTQTNNGPQSNYLDPDSLPQPQLSAATITNSAALQPTTPTTPILLDDNGNPIAMNKVNPSTSVPIGSQSNPGAQTLDNPALRFEASLAQSPIQAANYLNTNDSKAQFKVDANNDVIYSQDGGNTWNKFQTTLPNEFNWNSIISSLAQKEPEITEGIGTGVGAALGTGAGPVTSVLGAAAGGGLANAGNQLLGNYLGVAPFNGQYGPAAKQVAGHAAFDAVGEGLGKMVVGPVADSMFNVGLGETGGLTPRQLSPAERFGSAGSLIQKISNGSIADNSMRAANQSYTENILNGLDKNIFNDTEGLTSIPDDSKPAVGASLSQINKGLSDSLQNDNNYLINRIDNFSSNYDPDDPNGAQELDSLGQAKSILDPVIKGINAGEDFSGMKTGQLVKNQGNLVNQLLEGDSNGVQGNIAPSLNLFQRYLGAELKQNVMPNVPGSIDWGALNSEATNPMGINYIQNVLQPNRLAEAASPVVNQLESIKQIGSNPSLFPQASQPYSPSALDKLGLIGDALKLGKSAFWDAPIGLGRALVTHPFYDPYGALGRAAANGIANNQKK